MEEFLRSGALGEIRLGDSREQVQRFLGSPQQTGGSTRKRPKPTIWKYGDIEFHFSTHGEHLWLIFCDNFERLNLASAASLDPWFFVGQPSPELVEQHLADAKLESQRADLVHEPGVLTLRLKSGVELLFAKHEDPMMHPPQPGLFGFQHRLAS